MQINLDRLSAEIGKLAEFSASPPPSVTRVLFSPEDRAARDFLVGLATRAGLECRTDAVGNLFFRWEGTHPGLPSVATGSHIDAIPNAGKFDGVVGVLGGLEAIRALRESGFQPAASIELILFTSEEPTRFGLGCLGSRLMSGALDPEAALALADKDGRTLRQWLAEMKWGRQPLSSVPCRCGAFSAFVELHIEQGPVLEAEGLAIGIVEKIAAPAAFRVRLTGEGGHAGAVLMPDRRDAGLGAAELALAVERVVLDCGSPDGVGTTGIVQLFPGAINSIPATALLEIDLRDTDPAARERVESGLRLAAQAVAAGRGLELEWTTINSDPPAVCDPGLVRLSEEVCAGLGLPHRRMVSRAYHDSLFMALLAPTTMLFIPCRKGFSHRPDEYAAPESIESGVRALARLLARLSIPPDGEKF